MKKVMLAGAVALAFATVAVGTASVEASSYYTSGTHYHNTWNTTSTENYRRNNFKKRKEELKLLAEKKEAAIKHILYTYSATTPEEGQHFIDLIKGARSLEEVKLFLGEYDTLAKSDD
ncbi:hypothetical protein [Streptococcus dysgalactiae]|uniref:Uncharacterized protein n=1 Tax=Streptococcus dysgalactiae TaxID=1334 RepID=A0A9X9QQ63_STRDY|nr:hypothetical protein [Streptococcus dysgalactiae]VTS25640.1 Uncharacterised protein [Streptococcus dysgalactiae subsp. equisimilis]VTS39225.1 Uncharacterised protein [Streptococcus dysgalactiae subsp. equisimilis]VTS80758.1 Uncharacterised protein [Streptococcus dysgalactiae]